MKLVKKLILASNSPRRYEILKSAGFEFEKIIRSIDENLDGDIETIAELLAVKKAAEYNDFNENHIILTADTVVICGQEILNKPENQAQATEMLKKLSGQTHKVITGVCIKIENQFQSFSDQTLVTFKTLTDDEIEYYIQNYEPFDKAGAYGVQEFIGMIGIESIQGSFYTVMGLPIHRIYEQLKPYLILK